MKRTKTKSKWTAESVRTRFEDPAYRPLTQRSLLHDWQVEGKERRHVREHIRTLLDAGTVALGRGGRLEVARSRSGSIVGLLRRRGGHPQVVPEGVPLLTAVRRVDHLRGDLRSGV